MLNDKQKKDRSSSVGDLCDHSRGPNHCARTLANSLLLWCWIINVVSCH